MVAKATTVRGISRAMNAALERNKLREIVSDPLKIPEVLQCLLLQDIVGELMKAHDFVEDAASAEALLIAIVPHLVLSLDLIEQRAVFHVSKCFAQ